MKPVVGFIKIKQLGQAKAGAGWNEHVNKFQKQLGNKVIRRLGRDDIATRTLEK
jgi:hypothetical protein